MEIAGSVIVITGGASGLGFATAKRMLAGGASVNLLDVDEDGGILAAEELGEESLFVRCDVRDPSSVVAALSEIMKRHGRVDVLVNAAGVATAQRVVKRDGSLFDLDRFRFTIDVNLIGMFDVIRNVAGAMAANEPRAEGERGVIVNVASIAAFDGQIGQAAYSASKGGIVGMTLPLARDLSSLGIRVVTVAPGLFNTPLISGLPEETIAQIESQAVFPSRLGDPSEFAHLVQAVVENPYINGETIRLDAATRLPVK